MTTSQTDVDKVMAAFGAAPITYRPSQDSASDRDAPASAPPAAADRAAASRHAVCAASEARSAGCGRTGSRDISVTVARHPDRRRPQCWIDTKTWRRSACAAEDGTGRSPPARHRTAGARGGARACRTSADQARGDRDPTGHADKADAIGASGSGSAAERSGSRGAIDCAMASADPGCPGVRRHVRQPAAPTAAAFGCYQAGGTEGCQAAERGPATRDAACCAACRAITGGLSGCAVSGGLSAAAAAGLSALLPAPGNAGAGHAALPAASGRGGLASARLSAPLPGALPGALSSSLSAAIPAAVCAAWSRISAGLSGCLSLRLPATAAAAVAGAIAAWGVPARLPTRLLATAPIPEPAATADAAAARGCRAAGACQPLGHLRGTPPSAGRQSWRGATAMTSIARARASSCRRWPCR